MGISFVKMATIGALPSPLKVMYYKFKGAKIGKNVSIGLFSILNCDKIVIGSNTKIGHLCYISCKELKFGKRVKINTMSVIETGAVSIADDSTIMEQVVIGGMLTPRSRIDIGKRVKIFPYSFLNPTEPITIEDDVGIGGANYIFTHGSWQSELEGYPVGFGPVTIKRGVWFPWRVFVLPNVTVGEYATIGAGSVINRNIPDNVLAAGSPAKVLRQADQYLKKLTFEEKHDKVMGYMKEMVSFSKYQNQFIDQIEETIDKFAFKTKIAKSAQSIHYAKKYDSTKEMDVVISLSKIEENDKQRLVSKGKIYFDLSTKETVFIDEPIWYNVRDFFSRYGVRFNVVN